MASPDTDELEAGTAAGPSRGRGAAGVQQTEPPATEPGAAKSGAAGARGQGEPAGAGLEAAGAQQTEPLAAGAPGRAKSAAARHGAAEVRKPADNAAGALEAGPQQTEPLATEPGAAEAPGLGEPAAAEAQTVPQERVDPERIEPDAAAEEAAPPAKQPGRWWRGFTGSLAAGLTVLAIGVLAVAGIDLYTGAPGPGPALLIGHPVAAMLALLAQRVADRRNGAAAAGAGLAVVLFAVSALTLFWLT